MLDPFMGNNNMAIGEASISVDPSHGDIPKLTPWSIQVSCPVNGQCLRNILWCAADAGLAVVVCLRGVLELRC